jgi:DNA polymerase III alpha subunit
LIDIDYLPVIRDYLKDKYVVDAYGKDKVCNIASYTTFGLKSSLIDMARVFSEDRGEILALTTRLGLKDDEGEPLSWDKAMDLYPELQEYCEKHEDTIADAARNLLYAQQVDWEKFDFGHPPHRNRGMGQHASGLIISGKPLTGFLPLVKGKNGLPASAWVEGLASTDLSSVGLIKFDFLALEANNKIAACNKLIMERHGLKSICALPGQPNWSDISYLEDKEALSLANKGDLKAIFQYDSDGIRALVRKGGVSCWDDLAAYSAIYRPSCLQKKMDEMFIRRKKGEEKYEVHPALEKFLGNTYNVILYQEQAMQYIGYVGKIPEAHLYDIIKAISKKKIEKFKKFKEQFITNGQETLGLSQEEMVKKWDEIEAWAGYGFNKCLVGSTKIVDVTTRKTTTIEKLFNSGEKITINSVDVCGNIVPRKVVNVFDNGIKPVFKLATSTGKSIIATVNHKFLGFYGWKQLADLNVGDLVAIDNGLSSIRWDAIKSIKCCGEERTYDLEVEDLHNYVAEGIVVHNSHTCAYTYISSRQLWQKAHYPIEFFCSALSSLKTGDDRIKDYIQDARRHKVELKVLDLNKSKEDFSICDNKIYYGFGKIKGIGEEIAKDIVAGQPYDSLNDFLQRFGSDLRVVQPLIALGAFGEISPSDLYIYYQQCKQQKKKIKDRADRYEKTAAAWLQRLRAIAGSAADFDEDNFAWLALHTDGDKLKELLKIKKGFDTATKRYENSCVKDADIILDNLDGEGFEIEKDVKELLSDRDMAQEKYLGFQWVHPVEKAPTYDGTSFSAIKNLGYDKNNPDIDYPVEILIKEVYERTSKAGKIYYTIRGEDATSQTDYITVWETDYLRFAEKLEDNYDGRVVRLRVCLSKPPFNSLNLKSYPPWQHKALPAADKDERVVVLLPGKLKRKAKRKIVVEEESFE